MGKIWVIAPEQAGLRLDRFLVSVKAGPSRTALQKAIAMKLALVNGYPERAAYLVSAGDQVSLDMPPPAEIALIPENIPLRIIYEDPDLLVVDKPRGLVVHPAAGNVRGTLVNAILAHCHDLSGIGGTIRPGIVHRLDKDTTGLLVVAKNDLAHLGLAAQLKERTMARIYLALVHGTPALASGRLEMPIGRHPVDRKRMSVSPRGRPAITNYRTVETLNAYSLLRLSLATGRTHQIRVHLAAAGHPIVGDRTYGSRRETLGLTGQALHAGQLSFMHPRHATPLSFTAEPPPDFMAALAEARRLAGWPEDAPVDP